MLLGPNKKAAQMIARDMKNKPYVQKMGEGGMAVEISVEKPEMADKMMAKEAQAKKLLSAFESKDAKALMSAFEGMMMLCEDSDEMGEMEEGEG